MITKNKALQIYEAPPLAEALLKHLATWKGSEFYLGTKNLNPVSIRFINELERELQKAGAPKGESKKFLLEYGGDRIYI
ncbi:hypothetical protein NQX30_04760 [Candidatus Persebacteraceae bacterium Df01]|jgi:hypothetical protein|uniref:Uncharacterized protein n=1 Tax=Candidatus Doriopsillibacter californiensis TaxID=2970740 RepID=A0ABT7QLT4_9GAMM|nr:hypothetical protein [Candidatus Persebacteraceae bacterium Df01]